MTENKIKNRAQLKKIISRLKCRHKKIVFTNGCFDILHSGHIRLLEKAKSLGDILVVAINSDSSVKKLKGPQRPVNALSERARIVAALEGVDYVTSFSEIDPSNIIRELKPDVLVKGGDWQINQIVGRDIVKPCGGKAVAIPYLKGCSTRSLIKKICKRFASRAR